MIYDNLNKKVARIRDYQFIVTFINGAKVEIKGGEDKEFNVKFYNNKTNELIYNTSLKGNMWSSPSLQYFVEWRIEAYDINNNKVYEHIFNANKKRVFINFESKALGDTISWFPYIEEFRKKHNCDVAVSTFHNSWFEEKYPKLEFIKKGSTVYNLYAQYNIGWFYLGDKIDYRRVPINFRINSLGRTCSSTLGLDFKEIKPKLSFKNTGPLINDPYICIAPHASALAKYWNYPGGWQELIDYFNSKGYKVMMITSENLGDDWHDSKLGGMLENVIDRTGLIPFEEIANDLMNAKAFIGVSSGLSWLSWALSCPTTIISGFTHPLTEMKNCNRIFTPSSEICNGCFSYHKLDPSDWEWCPEHKDTFRQFECTKKILPSTVINSINKQLGIL